MPLSIYNKLSLCNLFASSKCSLIEHDEKIIGTCMVKFKCACGNEETKRLCILDRLGIDCRECAVKRSVTKCKNTLFEKYGVTCQFQRKEIKDISKQKVIEKYGVDNVSKSEEIKQKKIDTTLKNYGVTTPLNSEIVQKKIKENNIIKYGHTHPMKNDQVKENLKNVIKTQYVLCAQKK